MASLAFLRMTFSSNARIRAMKMGVFSFAQSMSLWNDRTCSPHGVSFLLFRVSVKCSWTRALIDRCVSPMYSFEQIVQVSEYTANCRSQCVSFNPARQDMQSSRGRPLHCCPKLFQRTIVCLLVLRWKRGRELVHCLYQKLQTCLPTSRRPAKPYLIFSLSFFFLSFSLWWLRTFFFFFFFSKK